MKKSEAKEAKRKKKKTMLIATLATAALIVGGLTFAWYTSKDSVTNTFKTAGSLKTVVVENFTPPTNWQPGVTTDKVVQVTNTGTVDAYTRVRLDEVLKFYAKTGDQTDVNSALDTDFAYFTVDAEAIEKTVATWNAADTAETQQYKKIQESDLKDLVTSTGIDTSKVVIYVKQSTGNSEDADTQVIETGTNYDFIGYYDTGKTIDNENNVLNDTATGKKLAYELTITPNIIDNQTVGVDESSGKTVVTHNYSTSTLDIKLSNATLKTIDSNTNTDVADNISTYIQLEFNEDSDWYFSNGYYYYQNILTSGSSTTPLLKAVRFKDSVGNEIANAVYQLTVVSDSTQAVEDAAVATWKLGEGDTATFDTIFGSGKSTNIVKSTPADTNACTYSVDNDTVCSDDKAITAIIGTFRTHDTSVGVNMPTASTSTSSSTGSGSSSETGETGSVTNTDETNGTNGTETSTDAPETSAIQ
jgi:alternate signal-mediated exported protein